MPLQSSTSDATLGSLSSNASDGGSDGSRTAGGARTTAPSVRASGGGAPNLIPPVAARASGVASDGVQAGIPTRIGKELNSGWAYGTPPASPYSMPRNPSGGLHSIASGLRGSHTDLASRDATNWSASLVPSLGLPPQRVDTDDDLLHKQVR